MAEITASCGVTPMTVYRNVSGLLTSRSVISVDSSTSSTETRKSAIPL